MYSLLIATAQKVVFDDLVYSLIAPGTLGYLEILSHHADIITSIQIGKLTVTNKHNVKLIYAITGGILEVSQNKGILLADTIEAASEIDIRRAKLAAKRARAKLESPDKSIHLSHVKDALRRAENRIKIYKEFYPDKAFEIDQLDSELSIY